MEKKKRLIPFILVILAIISISSCGSKDKPTKVAENSNTATETTSKENNKTQIFKIGDVVQLKDYKITVNKVRTDKGDKYMKPESGNDFFYVDCTVENISDKSQIISSIMMFKVQDSDGRSYNQAITAKQNGKIDGELSAGLKMTGEYVVQVPTGKTGLQLVFDGSLLSGGQTIVQLN